MIRYIRKAQYHETDQMGVIYHANYFKWMEEARVALLDSLGFSYAEIERSGIAAAVVGVSAEYRKPVCFGDEVTVDARVAKYNGVTVTFAYEIRNAVDGAICTTGMTKHCFLKDGKAARIGRILPGVDKALRSAIESDVGEQTK